MKKNILSFALFMGLASIQNSLAVNTPVGYEAAEWISTLAAEQNTTNSELMRKFILIKHTPLLSLLGGVYLGTASYTIISEIENVLRYRDPENFEKLSPNARKFFKIIATVPFALFGGWIFARSYQNWKAVESILYNPSVMR